MINTTGLACNSKAAATAALETIAGILPRGTQRDALLAVISWISENIAPDFTEETKARIQSIFEGSEWEKKGRAWLDREMEDPRRSEKGGDLASDGHHYSHEMINEPEDGAELECFYHAGKKRWEPVGYGWPPCLHQQASEKTDE